ncbi:hypothetical protein IAT38_003725 [Cryptococcus sp. DSM 104549]
MEVNKEEALRALSIAQRHRNASNLPSALKFARKSVALYSTPEGEAMITVVEREIEVGGSAGASSSAGSSAQNGGSASGSAKASGVEEHVTEAHSRPGHGAKPAASASSAGSEKPKKREYTAKQMEVVKRVKGCKHHEYYEILSVEKTCEENDVKRAYKKLALALHPDKNGAPGADEAFKMVSKAFQVLSDGNLRAAYDSNPSHDPTQRGGGVPSSRGGGGMGMHPGFGGGGAYQTEINPEDLFNMFFGGGPGFGGGNTPFGGGTFGGGNVFTFGGPGGFQAHYGGPRRPRAANAAANAETSPLLALVPMLLVFLFALLSIVPAIFSTSTPDPAYSFEPSTRLNTGRETFNWKVPYFVNGREWEGSDVWKSVPETRRGGGGEAMYSSKVRSFEKSVETHYVRKLQNECGHFNDRRSSRIADASGFFGIGADQEKIKELRAMRSPACEQLRAWGVGQGSVNW